MKKHLLIWLCLFLSFTTYAQESNIISQEAFLQTDKQAITLIDVRSIEEFQAGHIAHALNIPHQQILANPNSVLLTKDQPIVLYCRSGRRAKLVEQVLVDAGYRNIKLLQGDMLAWLESGLPVVK